MLNRNINTCKVCGYSNSNFFPWGEEGKYPMFEICPCCGIESGYEDISSSSIAINREKWVESSKYKSDIRYKNQLEKTFNNHI